MKRITVLLFFIFNSSTFNFCIAQTYSMSTVAGLGGGFSGDGGVATNARLLNPNAVCVDNKGNVYIADWQNSRVRMVNTNGIINTIAGNGVFGFSGDGGNASSSELRGPVGLVADNSGNLYIADIGNSRIRRVALSSGIISTFAGNGVYGFSGDNGAATAASFEDPTTLVFDNSGNMYISDVFNNRIRKINDMGIISTFAGNGVRGFSGDGGPAVNAEFYYPTGIATDYLGNAFITDADNYRIRKVNSEGIISTIAGNGKEGDSGDEGPATEAEFYCVESVTVDNLGNIIVADALENKIRKIDNHSIIATIAGTGKKGVTFFSDTATSAPLNCPSSIVADNYGNIYVSNQFGNRINKLSRNTDKITPGENYIYPNPNQGIFYINIQNSSSPIVLEVFNILGQRIMYLSLSQGINEINIPSKSAGMYFYRVTAGGNNIAKGKVIVL